MENNRRIFIKNTALASLGLALIPGCLSDTPVRKIGIQLYTVRDLMATDAVGTMKAVANLGYNQIETAGYADGKIYGMDPASFKQVVDDLGLEFVSGHMGLGVFRDGFDQALEFMVKAGQKYAVLPWLMPDERNSLDLYKGYAELLNVTGEKAKAAGIQVCYHNHDFEFVEMEGGKPMDILLKETDPSLVQFELDLYWISKVDIDPVAFFKENSGRVSLWHVKDMANTAERGFAEVGAGTIDFARIFQNADLSGMKHFFVEQDQSADPMKSIALSYKNLTERILA